MKIKSVTLHNYRGYVHETFEFVDGLNAIIGDGGAGKSAVQKGIRFVLENAQEGSIHSSWILDKKGKVVKEETTYVEITTDDGNTIRREKNAKENKYVFNGVEMSLDNNGKTTPEAILRALNMGEVNIEAQFDSHFLLADNGGSIAKTLNKIANLDRIDKSISDINAVVKAIKSRKKNSDEKLNEYNKKLSKFDFLDSLEKDIQEVDVLNSKSNEYEVQAGELSSKLTSIKEHTAKLEEINKTIKYETDVQVLLGLFDKRDNLIAEFDELDNLSDRIFNGAKTLKELDKSIKYTDSVNALKSLMDRMDKDEESYQTLLEKRDNILQHQKELDSSVDTKYLEDCKILLALMDKRDNLNSELRELTSKFNSICDNEDELVVIEKRIQENFEKIKGSTCPNCGNEISSLKEVC